MFPPCPDSISFLETKQFDRAAGSSTFDGNMSSQIWRIGPEIFIALSLQVTAPLSTIIQHQWSPGFHWVPISKSQRRCFSAIRLSHCTNSHSPHLQSHSDAYLNPIHSAQVPGNTHPGKGKIPIGVIKYVIWYLTISRGRWRRCWLWWG